MADAPSDKRGSTRVNVLALSDESAHVRSLARGWAAGEVSVDDYRTIRALTIEGMLSGELGSDAASDTQVSKSPSASRSAAGDHDNTTTGEGDFGDSDETAPRVGGVHDLPPASPPPSTSRVALIAGAVLLVIGLIVLLTLL